MDAVLELWRHVVIFSQYLKSLFQVHFVQLKVLLAIPCIPQKIYALSLQKQIISTGNHPSTEDNLKRPSLSPDELVKPLFEELNLKDEEISSLKSELEEKDKDLEVFSQENEKLKKELNEKMQEISSFKAKEDETSAKLNQIAQELETSKNDGFNIKEKLEATEKAKEALENEMRKLRVQTEKWRKVADTADLQ
ncbi:hypothetical protein RDI58_026908 [Solanum bulbocastanum]|uniref:Uncharacterized protein n=1 Tax=Solanum bulbocastanum TaxID=147425 RepID=A0AAN8SZW3_SOLBU